MKITVTGRNLEVTPALKSYAEGKMANLRSTCPIFQRQSSRSASKNTDIRSRCR